MPDSGKFSGFTLVEVLVALFVLAVGLLGLAMLQTTGLRFNTNSYSRTQATNLAYDLVERMRANVTAFSAGNYFVSAASAATIVTSTDYSCNSTAGSCACDVAVCSSAALASYDLGQWYYRLDTLLPGARDAANLASSPKRATIVSNGNNRVTITIYWYEQDRNAQSGANTSPTSQSWQVDIF